MEELLFVIFLYLGHTNLISCSSDFVPKKIGANERYDNIEIRKCKGDVKQKEASDYILL